MSCDSHRERIMDRVAGELPSAEATTLDAHLATCADCRAFEREMQDAWDRLGTLSRAVPPADLPGRFEQTLAQAGARADSAVDGRRWRTGGLMAAALAGLLVGAGAGWFARSPGSPAEGTAEPQYMLLLIEAADQPVASPAEMDAIVEEYRQWAISLADAGLLVSAEKLADAGGYRLVAGREPAARPATDEVLTGFFLIRARDYDEALRIARESPHLRYGGQIEVRAIEPT